MTAVLRSLCEALGLDEATVRASIWPQLQRAQSRGDVKSYLEVRQLISDAHDLGQSILGASDRTTNLIEEYTRSRSRIDRSFQGADLDAAFSGGSGTVYRKQDSVLYTGKQAHASRAASPAQPRARSPQVSPAPKLDLDTPPDGISTEALEQLRLIEDAIAALDPKGKRRENPCHCQARTHPLSPFTPLCPTCALAICTLNGPAHPCPSCGRRDLLSPSAAAALLDQQRSQRAVLIATERDRIQLERDEAARQRARESFPTLGDMPVARASTPTGPTSHKVLSLGRGGRVTATTTTYRSQSPKPRVDPAPASDAMAQPSEAGPNRQARKDAAREARQGWLDPFDVASPATVQTVERMPGRPFAHVDISLRPSYVSSTAA